MRSKNKVVQSTFMCLGVLNGRDGTSTWSLKLPISQIDDKKEIIKAIAKAGDLDATDLEWLEIFVIDIDKNTFSPYIKYMMEKSDFKGVDISETFSKEFAQKLIREFHIDIAHEDGEGQLIFKSGIFRWSDGTFHNAAEVR